MIVTVLATALMALSVLMVALDLRTVAEDMANSLRDGARHIRRDGRLASNLAFGCLWLMIFGLSYG